MGTYIQELGSNHVDGYLCLWGTCNRCGTYTPMSHQGMTQYIILCQYVCHTSEYVQYRHSEHKIKPPLARAVSPRKRVRSTIKQVATGKSLE